MQDKAERHRVPKPVLRICQGRPVGGLFPVALSLAAEGDVTRDTSLAIEFRRTTEERRNLDWYLEDYLWRADVLPPAHAREMADLIVSRGIELFESTFERDAATRELWRRISDDIPDCRIEIEVARGVVSLPWEIMRQRSNEEPLSVRARAFVRTEPSVGSFATINPGPVLRLLWIVARPEDGGGVTLRNVLSDVLVAAHPYGPSIEVAVLRPPTLLELERKLRTAQEAGHPYQVVHFDGHGVHIPGRSQDEGRSERGRGYLVFEDELQSSRLVTGDELGELLRRSGVPIVVLNACQSAKVAGNSSIGSNADTNQAARSVVQELFDHGLPGVIGMETSVYARTASEFSSILYSALFRGEAFGSAATLARRALYRNRDRWDELGAYPIDDWLVPIIYEAGSLSALDSNRSPLGDSRARHRVPRLGLRGRDDVFLRLDRSFDRDSAVLLHGQVGIGKTSTAVEFSSWYASTGGLGADQLVLISRFQPLSSAGSVVQDAADGLSVSLDRQIDPEPSGDPVLRWRAIRSFAEDRTILWIWDDIDAMGRWQEKPLTRSLPFRGINSLFAAIHSDPRTKVLLTSRSRAHPWLPDSVPRIELRPLRKEQMERLAQEFVYQEFDAPINTDRWRLLIDCARGNASFLRFLIRRVYEPEHSGELEIEQVIRAVRAGAIPGRQPADDQDEDLARLLEAAKDLVSNIAEDEAPILSLVYLFVDVIDIDVLWAMGEVDAGLAVLRGVEKPRLLEIVGKLCAHGLATVLTTNSYTLHPSSAILLRALFYRHYPDEWAEFAELRAKVRLARTLASALTGTAPAPFPEVDCVTASDARVAWVEALALTGTTYASLFRKGMTAGALKFLRYEEQNLWQAYQFAIERGRPECRVGLLEGIWTLHGVEGRMSEWEETLTRMSADVVNWDGSPLPGREDEYGLVASQRIYVALQADDMGAAQKLIEPYIWHCYLRVIEVVEGAEVGESLDLARVLDKNAAIDSSATKERHKRLDSLADALVAAGTLYRRQKNPACKQVFLAALAYYRVTGNSLGQAFVLLHLAGVLSTVPEVRNLQEAELAAWGSMAVRPKDGNFLEFRSWLALVDVQLEELRETLEADAKSEAREEQAVRCLVRLRSAEKKYSPDSGDERGAIDARFGRLYALIGATDAAQERLQRAADLYFEDRNWTKAIFMLESISRLHVDAIESATNRDELQRFLRRARDYAAAAGDLARQTGAAAESVIGFARLEEQIADMLTKSEELPLE